LSKTHIKLLELKFVERLVQNKARKKLSLVDSNVSRRAFSKGRSASHAVSTILRHINSLLVAADLYMINPFCPTKLNVAGDPTRDQTLCPWYGFGPEIRCLTWLLYQDSPRFSQVLAGN
jgi:hypothetical protein